MCGHAVLLDGVGDLIESRASGGSCTAPTGRPHSPQRDGGATRPGVAAPAEAPCGQYQQAGPMEGGPPFGVAEGPSAR